MALYFDDESDVRPDNSIDDLIDVGGLLRIAIDGIGCAHKVAAAIAGYGVDYWSRVLSNERGIVLCRLGRLPIAVQRAFVTKWAHALGMKIERADRAVLVDATRKLAEVATALAEIV